MIRVLVLYREKSEAQPYQKALFAAGADPVLARADQVPPLSGFGGLVLTGGPDIDPALYGETPQPETEAPDRDRDAAEIALLREAIDQDLPLLAICRGLQILNVFHGGTLIQHVENVEHHRVREANRANPAHSIAIEPGSLLASIAGSREWRVNSRHHQAIRKLGNHLKVTATDPEDQIIEAVERPDKRFVLAVQWHPENQALADAGQLRIFQRFAEMAAN